MTHKSYIDNIGTFHVIGEIQNNTPDVAQFVKVIGTFYDANAKVVGTSFTYPDPIDLQSKEKAPFDLILFDSTIPADQIVNYNLKITYR